MCIRDRSPPIPTISPPWLPKSTTDPVRFTTGRSPPNYSPNSSKRMLPLPEPARRWALHHGRAAVTPPKPPPRSPTRAATAWWPATCGSPKSASMTGDARPVRHLPQPRGSPARPARPGPADRLPRIEDRRLGCSEPDQALQAGREDQDQAGVVRYLRATMTELLRIDRTAARREAHLDGKDSFRLGKDLDQSPNLRPHPVRVCACPANLQRVSRKPCSTCPSTPFHRPRRKIRPISAPGEPE